MLATIWRCIGIMARALSVLALSIIRMWARICDIIPREPIPAIPCIPVWPVSAAAVS
jgi:hypothetical protein